jgi:predicted transposase YbfD/YdcC
MQSAMLAVPSLAGDTVENTVSGSVERSGALCPEWPVEPMPIQVVPSAGLVRGLDVEDCGDLRDFLADLPDPRRRQGRRYGYGALVAVASAAMLGGASSVAAIFRWARDAPDEILLALGVTPHKRTGRVRGPSLKTLRRLLKDLDGDALDAALARWVSIQVAAGRIAPGQVAIALDGKVMRGSRDEHGTVHLFAALLHEEAVVTGQRQIGDKTGETKAFQPLLDTLDIRGAVITADALHTVQAHATYLRERGAHYVFTVKENTPALFARIDALPWEDTPLGWMTADRGHGRDEVRTIKVLPAPEDLGFPGARQVILIERYVTDRKTGRQSAVAVLAVTSLTPGQAGPEELAALVRGHWKIESLHWLRDSATFREDAHQLRNGRARIMACLRNLAINALRLAGEPIAAGRQWAASNHRNPLTLLGIHLTM